MLTTPHFGKNLAYIFGTNWNETMRTKGAEKLAATKLPSKKLFPRESDKYQNEW